MPVIHLIGYPGSGKGVVSDALLKHLQFVPYSVGQLMRNEITANTDLGKQLGFIDSGKIAPPELAMQIIKKNVIDAQRVTLDGFPRTVLQAQAYLLDVGKPDLTILVNVSEKIAIQRLMKRAVDSTRKDDSQEIFSKRIQAYKDETMPCIKFLEDKGCKILQINGELPLEEMQKEAIKLVQNLLHI